VVAEGFPLIDITKMYLYSRNGNSSDGIPNRNTSVGKSPWIDEDPIMDGRGLLNLINNYPFMVGLK
jgi:hypothetical protein